MPCNALSTPLELWQWVGGDAYIAHCSTCNNYHALLLPRPCICAAGLDTSTIVTEEKLEECGVPKLCLHENLHKGKDLTVAFLPAVSPTISGGWSRVVLVQACTAWLLPAPKASGRIPLPKGSSWSHSILITDALAPIPKGYLGPRPGGNALTP